MFNKPNSHCQSCGMPMNKDAMGGGTNADGTKSIEYCSKCYQNGQFVDRDITVEQMREKVNAKIGSMGFPKFAARFMTRNIYRLKRWYKS